MCLACGLKDDWLNITINANKLLFIHAPILILFISYCERNFLCILSSLFALSINSDKDLIATWRANLTFTYQCLQSVMMGILEGNRECVTVWLSNTRSFRKITKVCVQRQLHLHGEHEGSSAKGLPIKAYVDG